MIKIKVKIRSIPKLCEKNLIHTEFAYGSRKFKILKVENDKVYGINEKEEPWYRDISDALRLFSSGRWKPLNRIL